MCSPRQVFIAISVFLGDGIYNLLKTVFLSVQARAPAAPRRPTTCCAHARVVQVEKPRACCRSAGGLPVRCLAFVALPHCMRYPPPALPGGLWRSLAKDTRSADRSARPRRSRTASSGGARASCRTACRSRRPARRPSARPRRSCAAATRSLRRTACPWAGARPATWPAARLPSASCRCSTRRPSGARARARLPMAAPRVKTSVRCRTVPVIGVHGD